MEAFARRLIKKMAAVIELIISFLLSVAIIVIIFRQVIQIVTGQGIGAELEYYLTIAMTLAIGVEFVKMLSSHAPSTVIEVLLFAISREMVVEHLTIYETLAGVAAIAGLFAIRKFLFCSLDDTKSFICRGSQTVGFACFVSKAKIPEESKRLLRDVVTERIKEDGRTVAIGACVTYQDCVLRVDHMRSGVVTRVEVIRMV